MWAEPGLLGSTQFVVAITAHTLGVVSLVCVWTVCDLSLVAVVDSSCGVRSWNTRHNVAHDYLCCCRLVRLLMNFLVILTFWILLLWLAILLLLYLVDVVVISLNEAKTG